MRAVGSYRVGALLPRAHQERGPRFDQLVIVAKVLRTRRGLHALGLDVGPRDRRCCGALSAASTNAVFGIRWLRGIAACKRGFRWGRSCKGDCSRWRRVMRASHELAAPGWTASPAFEFVSRDGTWTCWTGREPPTRSAPAAEADATAGETASVEAVELTAGASVILAVQVLHDHVRRARFQCADVDYASHVRALDLDGGTRIAREARHRLGAASSFRKQTPARSCTLPATTVPGFTSPAEPPPESGALVPTMTESPRTSERPSIVTPATESAEPGGVPPEEAPVFATPRRATARPPRGARRVGRGVLRAF
jgi:hypothetical protein